MNTRVRLLALVLVLTGALLSVPSAVATGGHDAGRTAGHQRFLLLSNDPEESGGTVLGFGPIHATGTDKVINDQTDRFVFPKGSVKIRHTRQGGTDHFDKVTCHGTFFEHGTWRAVDGTGRYSQASGGGTYRVHAEFIGCSQTEPPELFQLQIRAVGHLSF
jgi:hypothetical protein